MYKHLLIATDGSQPSAKALAHGLALAKSLAAQVTVVTVTEPWTEGTYAALPTPSMIRTYEKAAAGNAATILEGVKRAADEAGAPCETRYIKDQHAPEGNHRGREGGRMRSHHRGLARTRRFRPNAPRQHLIENPYFQSRRRSSLSLGGLGCGSYPLVRRRLAVWGGKIEDTYGAHDRGAFGGRVAQLGIRTDGFGRSKAGAGPGRPALQRLSHCGARFGGHGQRRRANVRSHCRSRRYDRRAPCRAHHRSASTDAEYSAHRRGNARHHCVHPVSEASALKADAFQAGGSLNRRHLGF